MYIYIPNTAKQKIIYKMIMTYKILIYIGHVFIYNYCIYIYIYYFNKDNNNHG